MYHLKYPTEQTDPPRPPWETLPTMYDLPYEKSPEEPGLPDEFHDLQPQLLSATFQPKDYAADRIFTASDMNLYYDVHNQLWYKRPDWFGVVDVSRLSREGDMRLSYVMWQELMSPFVAVELISPGTEKEDLGTAEPKNNNGKALPPGKWTVYEKILRIPFYVVFDRYTDTLRVFQNVGGHYEVMELSENKFWMSELKLGMCTWQGKFQGVERLWLRWFDESGRIVETEGEKRKQERAALEKERDRSQKLAQKLRELGIDPDDI